MGGTVTLIKIIRLHSSFKALIFAVIIIMSAETVFYSCFEILYSNLLDHFNNTIVISFVDAELKEMGSRFHPPLGWGVGSWVSCCFFFQGFRLQSF